ncbi:MAG: NUDIX hydrolase [Candidatus Saccharimonadales bacterium]
MTPEQHASCVLTDSQRRVLLIHRNTPRLTEWELPGGKAHEGETAKDAAAREALEELGVRVAVIDMLGSFDFKGNGRERTFHWFLARIVEGQPYPREDMHDRLGYFDLRRPTTVRQRLSTGTLALTKAIENNRVQL